MTGVEVREGQKQGPYLHDPGKPPKDAKGWPHFTCGALGRWLRALAGSAAVWDRVTEVCDATLTLLACLASSDLGRGGHVARLGLGLVGAPA